ncbi:MAG TPA: AAA family ATPase [Thermoguttaceae bacterium]|nr:AAA family ATPase [Thermoguttaceae bacterium]
MISSVEITRFRGIREGKLEDLTPLVVLVGPNGCGKSSILDALYIAANSDPGDAIPRVVERHPGVNDGPRWLFWRAGQQSPAETVVHTTKGSQSHCRLHLQRASSGWAISWRVECKTGKASSSGRGDVQFHRDGKLESTASGIAFREIPSVRFLHGDSDTTAPLHQLYSESRRTGRRGETKGLIVELIPAVEDLEILTEGNSPVLYFVYKEGAIPAALAGDGIYALVHVALELAACAGGLVLLEEPEVHQHPGAIRQTMRAILAAVRRDIQVILTTHSLELIDCLLAESSDEDIEKLSLYRLELQDGLLISRRLPGSEVEFSRTEVEKDLR